jgi:hypothetical protein
MTFKEKLHMEHPEMVDKRFCGGVKSCPYHYGYEKNLNCMVLESNKKCEECWNREMPNTEPKEVVSKEDYFNVGYNNGLADAWKLAQRINIYSDDGGLRMDELGKIFDQTDTCKIMCLSYEEALAKLKAYEERIEVGDIVLACNEVLIVVTGISNNMIFGIDAEGLTSSRLLFSDCKKTGKHIDIQSILEQIGE